MDGTQLELFSEETKMRVMFNDMGHIPEGRYNLEPWVTEYPRYGLKIHPDGNTHTFLKGVLTHENS